MGNNLPCVFEISYEVCNKVGGIYTVIYSKAEQMKNAYGENYYMIGPYNPQYASVEFVPHNHHSDELKTVFQNLDEIGIKCFYGTWSVPGKPKTILLDTTGYMKEANKIKTELWNEYKVDSINADNMFNEPVVWARACGILLENLVKISSFKDKKIIAHAHEWLSGASLLHIKSKKLPIATVFTTHATMLGRTIAGSGKDLYKIITDSLAKKEVIDTDSARYYGVIEKHTLEKAAILNADVFTTVSETTAMEAEYIHGRKPEIITLNGLDMNRFPGVDEIAIMREDHRERLKEFLTSYFCRYYSISFEHPLFIFISGRYEFHNKGIDVFIDALGKLNNKLKSNNRYKTPIIAFIFVPAAIRGENIEALKNKALYEAIKEDTDKILPKIKKSILRSITHGEIPKCIDDMVNEDQIRDFREQIAHFKGLRRGSPPLCAFDLSYPEQNDLIVRSLRDRGLLNREEDKVKVIFYPSYLSETDRLISMSYTNTIMACDIGVFPSFYEPWGYTPLEAAANSVISITTDLSGFGRFIMSRGINKDREVGMYVLKVANRSNNEISKDLCDMLHSLVNLPKKDLIVRKMNAKSASSIADWSVLIKNYTDAHKLALEKLENR